MAAAANPRSTGRHWLGLLGSAIVLGVFGWAVGPLGALAGVVIAVLWWGFPAPFVIAAGHVLAVAVLPNPGPAVVGGLAAGFLVIGAAPLLQAPDRRTGPVTMSATAVVLGGTAWVGWTVWEPPWLAGVAVVALGAVGLYGLHRYAIVLLEDQGAKPLP